MDGVKKKKKGKSFLVCAKTGHIRLVAPAEPSPVFYAVGTYRWSLPFQAPVSGSASSTTSLGKKVPRPLLRVS